MSELKLHATTEAVFGDRAHALDIALALADQELTIAECARRIGLSVSVLYRPVRSMCEAGLLECDGEEMGRGARYRLRPEFRQQAEAEAHADQPFGVLVAEQTLIVVEVPQITRFAEALTDPGVSSAVIWAAELDGGDRFLIALDRSDGAGAARARLRAAIESVGGDYRTARVARMMDASGLRAHLAAVRDI